MLTFCARFLHTFAVLSALSIVQTFAEDVRRHSVRWTTLRTEPGFSKENMPTYANSMPIGNGHVAANVNYESVNDTLEVLISSSSAWAEDGEFMKVVHFSVKLPSRSGEPLGENFSQIFNPNDATVRLNIPAGGTSPAVEVVAYVDAEFDSVVVAISPLCPNIVAALSPVRTKPFQRTPSWDCVTYPISADITSNDGTMVYHRNPLQGNDSYMFNSFSHLNIPLPQEHIFTDPLINRTTGAKLTRLFPDDTSMITFAATVLTAQTATISSYESQLQTAASAFGERQKANDIPPSSHISWWAEKWAQHSINISAKDEAFNSTVVETINRMYVLQRFIELSQAGKPGTFIKFNGMLYTANRPPNEDFNQWGGLNWWQNLRLPYYNMLTAGDADELMTLLVAFNNTVSIARSRVKAYYGFDGIFWPEYNSLFYGTQHPSSYRGLTNWTCEALYPEPIWHVEDPWNGYNRQGSLDLALMVLDHYAYTGTTESASLLHIPMEVVQFYFNLWANTTTIGNGKMVFHPTQALETWQCPGWPIKENDCPTNDMPTVAGLHAVIQKLLQLPDNVASIAQKAEWTKIKSQLPNLPIGDGRYIPCSDCNKTAPPDSPGSHRTSNGENAELYSVHPYRLATVGKGNQTALTLAKASYAQREFPSDSGWNQCVMDASLLGIVEDAVAMVTARALTSPALGYRFPIFAPHEQDCEPSADHFANFANGLQYMLIQRVDDVEESVVLLPTWPCEWDVSFTVTAPKNTTITGSLTNGNLSFSVSPLSRTSAVSAHACMRSWTCSVFGCTCQGMSDWYGTDAGIGFGCAPAAAQTWWKEHNCNTRNSTYPCKDYPSPCDAPGCRHGANESQDM